MKELLEDYQRKYSTINEMIRFEIDPDTLARLKTKSICYREFMNELERNIKKEKEINITTNMDMFLNSFNTDKNEPYSIQKGFFPYLGKIKYDDLTPMAIINKIHEHGFLDGIETGKYQKILELKKVLDIKDED